MRSLRLGVFVLLLASCGDDDGGGPADGSPGGADAPQADAPPPDAPPPDAAPPDASGPLPNLILMGDRIGPTLEQDRRFFQIDSCALAEMCVGDSGQRDLLRFDTVTANLGTADLYVGEPDPSNPLFVWSPCHQHFHFQNYAVYELLAPDGTVVAAGHKQAFCLEDTTQIDLGSNPDPLYTCGNQGIHMGWADTYGSYLDCQWIDITGLPPGDYVLRIVINPERILPESNYDDNSFEYPVTLPCTGPGGSCG